MIMRASWLSRRRDRTYAEAASAASEKIAFETEYAYLVRAMRKKHATAFASFLNTATLARDGIKADTLRKHGNRLRCECGWVGAPRHAYIHAVEEEKERTERLRERYGVIGPRPWYRVRPLWCTETECPHAAVLHDHYDEQVKT